jgi:hypothetical protein
MPIPIELHISRKSLTSPTSVGWDNESSPVSLNALMNGEDSDAPEYVPEIPLCRFYGYPVPYYTWNGQMHPMPYFTAHAERYAQRGDDYVSWARACLLNLSILF